MRFKKGQIPHNKITFYQFVERLEKEVPNYNKHYSLEEDYTTLSQSMTVDTPYGKCKMRPMRLLYGYMPTVKSALNKTEFIINKIKEVRGDEIIDYSRVSYKDNSYNIIIGKNGYWYNCNIYSLLKGNKICKSSLVDKTSYFMDHLPLDLKSTCDFSKTKVINFTDKILFNDGYGDINMKAYKVLNNCQIGLLSVVDRKEYLSNKIESLYGNDYKVVSIPSKGDKFLVLEDKYGKVRTRFTNLFNGKRPSIESAIDKNEYIINMFREIHNNTYDYSLVKYKTMKSKVNIICSKHGVFSQSPDSHFRSETGCPKCAESGYRMWGTKNWLKYSKTSDNFNSYKLYIIKLYNDDECFLKVGKTYCSVDFRYKTLKDYNYDILKIVNSDSGESVSMMENNLHSDLYNYKYIPKIKFAGYTECYPESMLEKIEEYIKHL